MRIELWGPENELLGTAQSWYWAVGPLDAELQGLRILDAQHTRFELALVDQDAVRVRLIMQDGTAKEIAARIRHARGGPEGPIITEAGEAVWYYGRLVLVVAALPCHAGP